MIVTGAAGFLGSHLCERFLKQGYNVVGLDNFSTGSHSNPEFLKIIGGDQFAFFDFDCCQDWKTWMSQVPAKFLSNVESVFHFASPASPPLYQALALETMWINSTGLFLALEAATSLNAKCVFASTSEVYGDPNISPQPESYWGNVNSFGVRSCYDESKRFGEALIFSYNDKKKTNHGMVRIFNTYGPRMNPRDGRVIINFLVQALEGKPLTVYGDGNQSRSFCYVDDLVNAITAYAKTNLTSPVNIGNQNEFTILELAKIVQEMFPEKNLSIQHEPLPGDDPKQRCPDTTLARKYLNGWEPKIQLRDGLKEMVSWLKTVV